MDNTLTSQPAKPRPRKRGNWWTSPSTQLMVTDESDSSDANHWILTDPEASKFYKNIWAEQKMGHDAVETMWSIRDASPDGVSLAMRKCGFHNPVFASPIALPRCTVCVLSIVKSPIASPTPFVKFDAMVYCHVNRDMDAAYQEIKELRARGENDLHLAIHDPLANDSNYLHMRTLQTKHKEFHYGTWVYVDEAPRRSINKVLKEHVAKSESGRARICIPRATAKPDHVGIEVWVSSPAELQDQNKLFAVMTVPHFLFVTFPKTSLVHWEGAITKMVAATRPSPTESTPPKGKSSDMGKEKGSAI